MLRSEKYLYNVGMNGEETRKEYDFLDDHDGAVTFVELVSDGFLMMIAVVVVFPLFVRLVVSSQRSI